MKKHLDQLILSSYINILKNRHLVESYNKLHEASEWQTDHPLPSGKISPAAKNAWVQVFSNPSFQYMSSKGVYVVKNIADTGTPSQHTYGNAIDFAGTASEMQELSNWLVTNANSLSVNNIIYNERIWNPNLGWHTYNWKAIDGSPHADHVHVDFSPSSGDTGKRRGNTSSSKDKSSADILTAVTEFGTVGIWILNRGGSKYNAGGGTFYKYPDAKLGDVLIEKDGTATILKTQKKTNWKFYRKVDKSYELQIGGVPAAPKSDKLDTSLKKYRASSDIEQSNVLDQIQTTIDWLGFIPGYGDILDAINAIVYFARGKTLDGILSLIAIVPMVGSVASKAIKGAIKTFPGDLKLLLKQAAKSGDPTDLAKFWKHAIESGRIDKATLQKLAKYGDELAILLTSGKRKILESESELKVFGINAKAIGKQIDKVSTIIQNTYTKPIKKAWYSTLASSTGRVAKDIVTGIVTLPVKLIGKIFNVSANVVTLGTYSFAKNILRKLNPNAPETAAKLVKALDVTFKKKMMDSPTIVTALIKQESPRLLSKLTKTAPAAQLKTTNDLYKYLTKLKKINPSEYTNLVTDLHATVTKSGNPYYRLYVNNSTLAAMNIFKPGAVFQANIDDSIKNLAKNFSLSNPKAWDVISNEIEDIAERLGFDPEDNPQSVIVASVLSMVNYLSSDRYKEADKSKESGDAGTFTRMKKIYDETPGGSSDKLQALATAGFSEVLIRSFTKEQGK